MDAEEYRMKISRDWKAVVDYAWEEGYKRGLARAEAKAKARAIAKMAKAARDAGVAMDIIIEATGLTEEQINNL